MTEVEQIIADGLVRDEAVHIFDRGGEVPLARAAVAALREAGYSVVKFARYNETGDGYDQEGMVLVDAGRLDELEALEREAT